MEHWLLWKFVGDMVGLGILGVIVVIFIGVMAWTAISTLWTGRKNRRK